LTEAKKKVSASAWGDAKHQIPKKKNEREKMSKTTPGRKAGQKKKGEKSEKGSAPGNKSYVREKGRLKKTK